MQLMKIMPLPRLASIAWPTCKRVASATWPRSNLHHRLVDVVDVVLVLLELVLDEIGVVAPVGDRRHHRIGDMADAAQPRSFQRQLAGRNIHAHAADHDGHQFAACRTAGENHPRVSCALSAIAVPAGVMVIQS